MFSKVLILDQSGFTVFHCSSFQQWNHKGYLVLSNISHFQKLFGCLPNLTRLFVILAACVTHNTHKLQFRYCKCFFLWYSSVHKGYSCLHPSGRVFMSWNVIFNELEFPYLELFSSLTNVSSSQTKHTSKFVFNL